MAGASKKRSTNVATKRKRSASARKGWETRRENEHLAAQAAKRRSKAAKQAARTRKARELERIRKEEHARRSRAAKRGAAVKKAKSRVALAYGAMMNAYARGAKAGEWNKLRPEAHDAKWQLFDAVDSDRDRYLEILDDIADDLDTDWHIAYGPGGED